MKIIIISYSLTGNNEALANSLTAALDAEHIRITESKRRTMGTISFDILFNRTPQVNSVAEKVQDKDLVMFISPVWMGKVATPLRGCFKQLAGRTGPYMFVSISGGADGSNPKLAGDLEKRMGKEPAALIDMHIADLLPQVPTPRREDISAYRLRENDIKTLTEKVISAVSTISYRKD